MNGILQDEGFCNLHCDTSRAALSPNKQAALFLIPRDMALAVCVAAKGLGPNRSMPGHLHQCVLAKPQHSNLFLE